MLELVDFTVLQGGCPLFRPITRTYQQGEIIQVTGVNGSGKTTLFRALSGLHKATRGRVRLNSPRVGYLPQLDRNLRSVTINQLAALCPSTRAGEARAIRLLEGLGAECCDGQPMGELTGGQKQRGLLACVLRAEPDVLLLDEPFAGCDPSSADLIRRVVQEAVTSCLILFVDHEGFGRDLRRGELQIDPL